MSIHSNTVRPCLPFVVLTVLAASAAPSVAQKAPKPKRGAGKQPAVATATIVGALGTALDAKVRAFDADTGGFSGVVLVARDGKVVLEQGYGRHDAEPARPMAVDSLWDWASVSKQFTAVALLRLQDKKKLKVDDALPKFWPKTPADKKLVTVRQLLNHTSGIQSGFRSEWNFDRDARDSFEGLVLKLPVEHPPGAHFDYSNSGYAFAAALVEKLSGTTFETFCVDEVLRPAGMRDACLIGWPDLDLTRVPKASRGAGFADRPAEFRFAYGNRLTWGYRGCGGVVATARDMLAWDRALRGDTFLSKQSKKDFHTVGKEGYALGQEIRRSPVGECAFHSGGVLGVVAMYYRLLDEDVVVALVCNFEPKGRVDQLAEELMVAAARGKG
jgi:CubicO group peptidase (beta-lactamase class C family)